MSKQSKQSTPLYGDSAPQGGSAATLSADDNFNLRPQECASFCKQCLQSLSAAGYKTSSASKKSLYDDAFSKRRAEIFLAEAEIYGLEGDDNKVRRYSQRALGSGRADLDSQVRSLQNKRIERFLSLAADCGLSQPQDEKYQYYLKEALAEGAEAQPRVEEIRKARAIQYFIEASKCKYNYNTNRSIAYIEKALREYIDFELLSLPSYVNISTYEIRKCRAKIYLAIASQCELDDEEQDTKSFRPRDFAESSDL